MLWRHLAYCDPLLEKLEAGAEPVDGDSDLEYEVEAFPTVSNEASAEAAAYVKVLISSGRTPSDCIEKGVTIEAPLTINIPRTNSTQHPSQNSPHVRSTSGVNISVPVYVPTQAIPTVSSAEGLDNAHVLSNNTYPPRRKRKPWSAEEEHELLAAVQRYGEGNWAAMLRGDFRSDRTASQLSQRWNIIKRRQNNPINKTGSQPSEMQLAARRAFNMAVDKPGLDIPKSDSPFGMANPGNVAQPMVIDSPSYDPTPTGPKRPFPRPQPFSNKPPPSASDAVKAAAVAAGARIATESDAAAIRKQQLKVNAIHIRTTRPPPPHGTHSGYSSISPNGPRPILGPAHANAKVGPVLNPVKEDQVAVSGDPKTDVVAQDNQVSGSGQIDPPKTKVESK
ncbi:homeodomain-like protein [Tanacetum coccineum]